MGNDVTIAVAIIAFLMLLGAGVSFINDSFGSEYTTNINGTAFYNSLGVQTDADCQQWYREQLEDKGLDMSTWEWNILSWINLIYDTNMTNIANMTEEQAAGLGLEPCPDTYPGQHSNINVWRVIRNMFASIVWTIDINIWLQLFILMPLRLALLFIIARNVWVGGGG